MKIRISCLFQLYSVIYLRSNTYVLEIKIDRGNLNYVWICLRTKRPSPDC